MSGNNTENSNNSESLHQRPNLVDQSAVTSILSQANDTAGLKTDDKTDMMFGYLVNEDKLVTEEERQFLDGGFNQGIDTSDKHSDTESISSRRHSTTYDNTTHNNNQHGGINIANLNEASPQHSQSYPTQNNTHHQQQNQPVKNDQDKEKDKEPEKVMTGEEIRLEKLAMLRKLGELTQKGVTLSQNYNMNSDLKSMQYEYDLHCGIRAKHNSINWMSSMMLNCIYGLEMMNDKYDPFSLKLTGWTEQMSRDITDYYDVFGELYEKYNAPGKSVPPEIKLLLMLTSGAIKFHFVNALAGGGNTKSTQEKLAENPDLTDQLRRQAQVDKMNQLGHNDREKLQEYINKQHESAVNKAKDIKMLNESKKEFQIKQEMVQKQEELNKLQQQLSINTASEGSRYSSPSQQPTNLIKPVTMPSGMTNIQQHQHQQQPPLKQQMSPQMQQQMQYQMQQQQQQQHIQPGPMQMEPEEYIRQQHIMDHKKNLQQQEYKNLEHMMKESGSYDGTQVSISPKLQELIMSSGKAHDTDSQISSVTTNADSISRNSKGVIIRRKRRKRNIPKIDTISS